MIDQASTLRLMAAINGGQPDIAARPRMRTLAVTSGKGGVGKSNLSVNVALELAALGRRVSLFDADLALANDDVLLGLNPRYHLGHFLAGKRTLNEVVIEVDEGLRLIPGGSGGEELANLTQVQTARIMEEIQALEADCMIIDTAAGIAENVTGVLRAADEIIVITTPDPTSIVDSYAMIKALHQQAPSKPLSIVVNDVVGVGDADRIFAHLQTTATRFLNCRLAHLGTIPRDAELAEAVREQVPVVRYAPNSPASRALRLIARQLDRQYIPWQATRRAGRMPWPGIAAHEVLRSH
ncbi:MAG: MinD/ParA family protein [Blastocatellia bacterium]